MDDEVVKSPPVAFYASTSKAASALALPGHD